jgi:hypothetical protein
MLSVPLKKLIFYIVHSKYVTKTQKYVKIVGREPSFFHLQRPTGVLALWLITKKHHFPPNEPNFKPHVNNVKSTA